MQLSTKLETASHSSKNLSAKEERQFKRALITQLETQQIEEADVVADLFVDMGIYETITPFQLLLQLPNHSFILQTAYNISSQQTNSQNIMIAVERAAKIVFALKNYARFDPSNQKTEAIVTEGIETVLTLYHNQLKQGIEVVRQYEQIPPLLCYPDELNQVWTNLIHNAIQAMNNQGTLIITVAEQNHHIVIQFTDSGIGIPENIKDRIFDPFFTTKPPGEGSGLGLDIVRKIVDKHQGEIAVVDSQPGRTTFRVSLPKE